VSFGHLGRRAFERWTQTERGREVEVAFEALTHPTMPEASSRGDPEKRAEAMRELLEQWNGALRRLDERLTRRDRERRLEPYGSDLRPEDRAPIPAFDLPAGSPPWWSSVRQWAERRAVSRFPDEDAEVEAKRATVVVTVPMDERPWHGE